MSTSQRTKFECAADLAILRTIKIFIHAVHDSLIKLNKPRGEDNERMINLSRDMLQLCEISIGMVNLEYRSFEEDDAIEDTKCND